MQYPQLGSSDLHGSAIGVGTWKTYGGAVARECIDTETLAAIEKCFR